MHFVYIFSILCVHILLFFLGNGNLAASMDHKGKIYIKGSQVLSQSINFYPVVQVDISGYQSQGKAK